MQTQVLYGTAAYRSRLFSLIVPRIFSWLRDTHGIILYGKRAWNSYIRFPWFQSKTQDVDILCQSSDRFLSAKMELIQHIVPILSEYGPVHYFDHVHHDGNGMTFTAKVCGETIIDLTWKQYSFTISSVNQSVCGSFVEVMSLQSLFHTLEEEGSDDANWRKTEARHLKRYYNELCKLGAIKVCGSRTAHHSQATQTLTVAKRPSASTGTQTDTDAEWLHSLHVQRESKGLCVINPTRVQTENGSSSSSEESVDPM